MNILETDWWSVCVPPEWWAEQDEETILIGDRDEVGCIEITTLCRDEGAFSASNVREFATGQQDSNAGLTDVELPVGAGYYSSFCEDEVAVREWYLGCGSLLLYISYSCPLPHRGLDDAAVDDILATLVLA